MGKLDELLKVTGHNIDESMGAGRRRPGVMHGGMAAATALPDRLAGVIRSKDAAEIPVNKIDRDPTQPREEFNEESLGRLAESMRTQGQLQPIRVRWDEDRGHYVIICGERRWRAARMAGLATMTCIIVDRPLEASELLALQLIENALREDLRPIEQAKAYRALMQANGWSGNQLAKELAIAQSSVVRALALLELPEPVQGQVEQGILPPSTAAEIATLDDPAEQAEMAHRVVGEKLTRAQVTAEVKAKKTGKATPSRGRREEFRHESGWKIQATAPADADDATLIATLEAFLAKTRTQFAGASRGEAA